jgi:hypothetical protein
MNRRLLQSVALVAWLATGGSAFPDDQTSILTLAPEAGGTIVFNWITDRCTPTDVPDAPARAFRDYMGQIHLMATHQDNRAFVGADFNHLSHPCQVVYEGDHLDDPSRFDDRQWLTSFVTDDGRNVFALVHDEFQGNLRPALCPSRKYMSCWYNAITFALSTDGGMSFHQPPAPANVIAAPSVPYLPDAGRPIGYFQPTNIVRKDSFYYFMFLATNAGAQAGGICVARSDRPADPDTWRAWDGTGFDAHLVGPYLDPAATTSHTCTPVGKGRLFELGSLAFDRLSGQFVYLGAVSVGSGDAAHPRGAYLSTSPDLIHWSMPMQLFRSPPADPTGENFRYGLFSLIDETSATRDFSEISSYDSLYLYFVKFDLANQPYGRILAKKQVVARPPS